MRFQVSRENYSTTEREALAVIFGIKKFEPYLYGRKFVLHTDHHSLKWLMSISDPCGRLARWSLLVQQYDFEIRHHPGAAHANADAPSFLLTSLKYNISGTCFQGPITRDELALLHCPHAKFILKRTLFDKCYHTDDTFVCPQHILKTVNDTRWLGLPWNKNSNLNFVW